jgi:hypothetical protein
MDILTTIIVAIFFFIMGAAVIGLIWYLQGVSRGLKGNSKNAAPADPNLSELARLMRHLQTQDLIVEMDGKVYKTVHELSQTLQHRLSFTSNVLAQWLAQPAPEPQPVPEPTAELPAPLAEGASAEPLPVPAEAEPVIPPVGYTPVFTPEPVEEIKPVSTQLPDVVGGLLNPAPKPEPEFKSIAGQINDILQAQLVGTALEPRGIKLSDAPDHGVMVTVDGKQYQGVMDVPDEDVRSAIRTAVLEWETKK